MGIIRHGYQSSSNEVFHFPFIANTSLAKVVLIDTLNWLDLATSPFFIMHTAYQLDRVTTTVLLLFAFIVIVALGPFAIIAFLIAVETKVVQVSVNSVMETKPF